jgi:hypothetical protein
LSARARLKENIFHHGGKAAVMKNIIAFQLAAGNLQ